MDFQFKKKPFDERVKDYKRAIKQYPDRIPIVVEAHPDSEIKIDKHKYLVPSSMTFSTFVYIIRKRILNLGEEEAIYLFVNNTLPQVSKTINDLREFADDDGFIYAYIAKEQTYGFDP